MQLKQYQADALAVLRRFFEEARMVGPKNAYETITTQSDYADRLVHYGGRYSAPPNKTAMGAGRSCAG